MIVSTSSEAGGDRSGRLLHRSHTFRKRVFPATINRPCTTMPPCLLPVIDAANLEELMKKMYELRSRLKAIFTSPQETLARAGLISAALLLIVGVGYSGVPQEPMPLVTTQASFVGTFGRPLSTARVLTAWATEKRQPSPPRVSTTTTDPAARPAAARPSTETAKPAAPRLAVPKVQPPAKAPAVAPPPPPPPSGPPRLAKGTENINPLLLQRFDAFRSFVWKEYGVTIEIRSGFRSTAEQAELFRTLPAGYANPPGTSQHEKGNAIDYTPYKPEFNRHLPMFGMKLPFAPKEQWHVEIVEPH